MANVKVKVETPVSISVGRDGKLTWVSSDPEPQSKTVTGPIVIVVEAETTKQLAAKLLSAESTTVTGSGGKPPAFISLNEGEC